MGQTNQLKSFYDCVIVGTGPAGLAAAYSLLKTDDKISILMLDAGSLRRQGKCFMEDDMKRFFEDPDSPENEPQLFKPCMHAKKCGVCKTIGGFGGCLSPNVSAKLCFPPSGKRLSQIMGKDMVDDMAKEVWKFYSEFAEINLPYPTCGENTSEREHIASIVKDAGYNLFEHPYHVAGEMEMNRFSENVRKFLEDRVDIVLSREVDLLSDLDWEKRLLKVGELMVSYGKIVLATGRLGYRSIQAFLKSIDMLSEAENMAFGQRIMMPNKYLSSIGRHYPDFKLKWEDEKFKYETFCFNGCVNGGRLKFMDYGGFINVDGLVSVDFEGDVFNGVNYGNFALLTECKVTNVSYNDGRPQDCLRLTKMPALFGSLRFSKGVQEIIAKVNKIPLREISKATMFTPMEFENIWGKIKTDNGFWVKPNVAVIGDASGIAMGIVSSMIMGFYVGSQIKRA